MNDAFIANELKARLLDHAPRPLLPVKRLELFHTNFQLIQYKEAEFDCVIASLLLLTEKNLTAFFQDVHRILTHNGIFLFSTLGREKPYELEPLGDDLLKLGFHSSVVDRELLTLHYEDKNLLLRDLKDSDLSEECVRIHTEQDDTLVATLDVMYGYALKLSSKASPLEIPIETIKIRKRP